MWYNIEIVNTRKSDTLHYMVICFDFRTNESYMHNMRDASLYSTLLSYTLCALHIWRLLKTYYLLFFATVHYLYIYNIEDFFVSISIFSFRYICIHWKECILQSAATTKNRLLLLSNMLIKMQWSVVILEDLSQMKTKKK